VSVDVGDNSGICDIYDADVVSADAGQSRKKTRNGGKGTGEIPASLISGVSRARKWARKKKGEKRTSE